MPVHIYWFAHYNLNCPSTRYRGLLLLEHIKKHHNIAFDFVIPDRKAGGMLHFIRTYLSALFSPRKNTFIVIQKVCTNRWYASLLKILLHIRPGCSLYDIDDAEYLRQKTESLHFFMRRCAMISVGSMHLEGYAKDYNSNVCIITSGIYEHPYLKKSRNRIPVIGWVGNMGNGNIEAKDFSHKRSLFEILFPAVKNLPFPCRLELIGVVLESDKLEIEAYFSDRPDITLDIPMDLNWEKDEWLYKRISHFDMGLAPMVDHEFNRAKSAFKVKQYLSCGVPAIASNIGENRFFVDEGKNGFLCTGPEDFGEAIKKLAQMPEQEYIAMSEAAHQSRENFSFDRVSKQLLACMMGRQD